MDNCSASLCRLIGEAPDRAVVAAIAAVSAAALAAALAGETVFGIVGCTLCVYQRVPYALAAAVAAIAFLGRPPPRGYRFAILLCAALFAIGGAIAFYHVGVQQGWWVEAGVCEAALPDAGALTDLRAALAGPQARPPCDQVDFSVLGLSLAALNVIYSAALAAACVVMARRPRPAVEVER